ncbi:MAG: hypothetical protein HYZ45_03280 [Burkholderiales bacterium]|nr:hypothetical protein [Burkholderiales bacterium]
MAAAPTPLDPNHPILGTWVMQVGNVGCLETYYFRADGTSLVTSFEEVAETVMEISAKPSRSGFYRWYDKLVKDNGKKDCSGKVSKVGIETTSFIRFLEGGERLVLCQSENLNTCFATMQRMHGTSL